MTLRSLAPLLAGFALLAAPAAAQSAPFTSSNLPIVLLDTGGAAIPNEPKITASMAIVDNGPGRRNGIADPPTGYSGPIGIEVRGASSQQYPKKQYAVETRDASGDGLDVSLLGLPEEEDWVLYAPYSDKSLMRNVLAYHIARATGHYASRTRFCEVVLNGRYQGVFVLAEKVKRDANRVDVNKLKPDEIQGDDLTGGYLLQIDRTEGTGSFWTSPYAPGYPTSARVTYVYEDPDGGDLVPVQKDYIRGVVTRFEALMASPGYADPQTGYASAIDVRSFVDYILVTELGRNVDGYRLSTYLHKDKDSIDPRLHAGPAWDFNLAFGNADYDDGARTSGFQADYRFASSKPVPFWWPKLVHEAAFHDSLAVRWAELRRGAFRSDSLAAFVSTTAGRLSEAQARNFERWPVLGTYVWPNAYVGPTYASEVAYLQSWLSARLAWLDGEFGFVPTASGGGPDGLEAGRLSTPSPNPSRTASRIVVSAGRAQRVRVTVVDALGRRVADVYDGPLGPGEARALSVSTAGLPAGVYVVRAVGETFVAAERLTVVR